MSTEFDISRYLKFQKLSSDCYYARLAAAAAECGLSRQEALVLLFFYNNPQLDTAADAARCRGFSKAFFSKAMEQLLRQEFIRIEQDPTDRRCQHIRLTPRALIPALRLRDAQDRFISELLRDFAPEERGRLADAVERLMENAERMHAD